MSLDRNIRWPDGTNIPPRAKIGQVLRDFVGSAGSVRWSRDRFYVDLPGVCSSALRRQTKLAHPFGPDQKRWIEVWPSQACQCVDVMTRQHDEFTNAIAVGIVGVIARWWKGAVDSE